MNAYAGAELNGNSCICCIPVLQNMLDKDNIATILKDKFGKLEKSLLEDMVRHIFFQIVANWYKYGTS